MDPNECLKRLRECVRAMDEASTRMDSQRVLEEADELVEVFDALDGWLRKGGFVPLDWQQPTSDIEAARAWLKGGR